MKTASSKFEFFPGQRRKVELVKWAPLMNAQSEKRIRLDLLMPLTGQSLLGIPNFVAPDYENMEREDSKTTESDIGVELEGVTIEGFSTDNAKTTITVETLGAVVLVAATMRNFKVVRETRDKMAVVCLAFSITVKRNLGMLEFADTYEGATLWCKFTETQPTIPEVKADSEQMALTGKAVN